MNPTDKRVKYGAKRTVWLRNYQRARGRALARLAKEYPDQYREYLEEERAKDEAEGKAWLDISGRTVPDTGVDRAGTYASSIPGNQTGGDEQTEGNLAGEA